MTDTATEVDERPIGGVEFRTVSEMGVRWPERVIEMVVMPYDTDGGALVHGRPVVESCAPGAFDGCERRANRVKVNRDHDPLRTVGRASSLHPSNAEGLVAQLRSRRHRSATRPSPWSTTSRWKPRWGSPSCGVVRRGWSSAPVGGSLGASSTTSHSCPKAPTKAGCSTCAQAPIEAEPRVATPNLDDVLRWWDR